MVSVVARKLTLIIRKLQKCFHGSARVGVDGGSCHQSVDVDVREGCFTILAVKNEEPMRFVVELTILQNPAFLRLLELAEEEYGFQHKGALAIPCQPDELRSILQDKIRGTASVC
ncbi:auxin-responsive protein SAUR32 [Andrographis paniculata]|uniref:auxin-responsive protein SAUR32 n=1 Tax=Andrographis paniculata TaxID=175694 RepID=UPI0021E83026|nr:auxin-responsive protein SAUR32 [Andrographis paniculata]